MLEIRQHHLQAFSDQLRQQETDQFVVWWQALCGPIGPIDRALAERGLSAARAEASVYGLDADPEDDPGRERLFVLAAVLRLMPAMNGTQFLLSADEVLASAPAAERISRLRAIAAGAG